MKQKIERGQAIAWPPAVLIYADGASRGNPGPASAGFVVYRQRDQRRSGKLDRQTTFLYEVAFLLGTKTNNFAEYSAVLEALKMSAKNQVQNLILKSDSELLVKQLSGLYRVKSSSLRKLYQECKKWEKTMPQVRFRHIPREQNKRADFVANLILDQTGSGQAGPAPRVLPQEISVISPEVFPPKDQM